MLSAADSVSNASDVAYHVHAAARAFYANWWILCGRKVSIRDRLRYLQSLVTSVACFGASHRAMYADTMSRMNVEFRKLVRQLVGTPPNID